MAVLKGYESYCTEWDEKSKRVPLIRKREQATFFLCLDSCNVRSSLVHAFGDSRSGRQTGSNDRGGIGIRIDIQEARASTDVARKVAGPLFLSRYTFVVPTSLSVRCGPMLRTASQHPTPYRNDDGIHQIIGVQLLFDLLQMLSDRAFTDSLCPRNLFGNLSHGATL